MRFGDISSTFADLLAVHVLQEIGKQPGHLVRLLSVHAMEEDDDYDWGDDDVGQTWTEVVCALVVRKIWERARRRKLDLIGPFRVYAFGVNIEGRGHVWRVLADDSSAPSLASDSLDLLLEPDGDLTDLAEAMAESFVQMDEEWCIALAGMRGDLKSELLRVLIDRDILPTMMKFGQTYSRLSTGRSVVVSRRLSSRAFQRSTPPAAASAQLRSLYAPRAPLVRSKSHPVIGEIVEPPFQRAGPRKPLR